MASFALWLLVLSQLPWGLASVAVPALPKVCGYDQVQYLESSSDEYYLLINGMRIEDPVLICNALESYSSNGCFVSDPNMEHWGKIGEKYCNEDFTPLLPVEGNISFSIFFYMVHFILNSAL